MALTTEQRIRLEKVIVRKAVKALLAAGYSIEVWNGGEEPEIEATTNYSAINRALFASDEDVLAVHKDNGSAMVRCIYGNEGWTVIADYSTSLDWVLSPVLKYADSKEVA